MKQFKLLALAFFSMCFMGVYAQRVNPYAKYTQGLPFKMNVMAAPTIPNYRVNLSNFGAKGDGSELCTDAFKKAFAALEKKGGGKLIVPQGVWYTGPIELKSNTELHLEKGAVILFAADESLYPIKKTSFEGLETRRCQSPISATNVNNIAITGQGAIDGNGLYWRPLKKQKVTDSQWKKFTGMQKGVFKRDDLWFPSVGYAKGDSIADMNVPKGLQTDEQWNEIRRFLRPVMVSLVGCYFPKLSSMEHSSIDVREYYYR